MRHVAVWVAAAAVFVLGAGWYTVFAGAWFAGAWLAGIGKTPEQLLQQGGPGVGYGLGFVAILVMCYALAWLVPRAGRETARSGAVTGAIAALGFGAAAMGLNYAFEMRPLSLWLINAGYVTAGLVLAGAILGGWSHPMAGESRLAA